MHHPTRVQKRWSGPLRTAGALLLLLGGVGIVDHFVGLAAPTSPLSPIGRAKVPILVALAVGILGALSFALGRRWR